MLAIYPTVRGYAFVLFEGPESPFDWGINEIRGKTKNASSVECITQLIDQYQPTVLVMENFLHPKCRRAPRIRKLYRSLVDVANATHLEVKLYDRSTVKSCFSSAGAGTKFEIALALARHIPAFKHRLPPLRKIWMSEDPRQSLFDAAALGVTYYCLEGVEVLQR